jgi:hypothetical protein
VDSIAEILEEALGRCLMEMTEHPRGYRPTDLGLRFLNDLQALFLPRRSATTPREAISQFVNLL